MFLANVDRWLAHHLPSEFLKDFYPRAMRRLAELGLSGGEAARETKHGFKMHVNRLDAIKWYVHYFGEFEPCITRAFKTVLSPGGKVVDIGGNIGYHAMLASVIVGSTGKVFTFEPATPTYEQLNQNLLLNDMQNVVAIKAAVSDRKGTAQLYLMGDNELGSSSLLNRGGQQKETVSLITFDDIAEMIDPREIDLIKIDVEGAEGAVISGMRDSLDKLKHDCTIFIEISNEDFSPIAPLTARGFQHREIANVYTTKFYRNGQGARQNGQVLDLILCRNEDVLNKVAAAC